MRFACAVVLGTSALAGCNRSITAPTPATPPIVTSPLPPASAVLGISLIGDQWITTTSTAVQMTARLVTSNSPFEYVDGSDGVAWSIDSAGVATIDQRGRVTPVGSGNAVVTAKYGDKTGTNRIRVLPDYAGTWSGEFVVTSCTGGHDFRECSRIMNPIDGGARGHYPLALTLSQDRDQVTGTLRETRAAGDIVAPVTGLVRVNGTLVIEASVPQPNHDPFRVFNWSSTANAASTGMSGAFTQIEPRRTTFGDPYAVRTEQEFVNLSRAR